MSHSRKSSIVESSSTAGDNASEVEAPKTPSVREPPQPRRKGFRIAGAVSALALLLVSILCVTTVAVR